MRSRYTMHIIKVGLNHQFAPLEIREKLTFTSEERNKAMVVLNEHEQVIENVILSTCNRTEIFAVVEQAHVGIASVQQFLMDWFQMDENELLPHLQSYKGKETIEHLFKLAVGLDSMVIGETQILGQVKEAFLTAQQLATTGKLFNELFKRV